MQAIMHGTRGLSLLIKVNWDRLLYAGIIVAALWAGAWIGTYLPF